MRFIVISDKAIRSYLCAQHELSMKSIARAIGSIPRSLRHTNLDHNHSQLIGAKQSRAAHALNPEWRTPAPARGDW